LSVAALADRFEAIIFIVMPFNDAENGVGDRMSIDHAAPPITFRSLQDANIQTRKAASEWISSTHQ